jgi:hypothetical protein
MALCGSTDTDDGTSCGNPLRPGQRRCCRHGGSRATSHGRLRTAKPRPTASGRRSSGTTRRNPTAPRLPAVPPSAHRQSLWQTPAPATSYRPAPEPPPAPSRREQERERVSQAAAFCADLLSEGWQSAVADRITGYAQTTWKRLSSRFRRKRNCQGLARIAREILDAKDQIHKLAGELVSEAVSAKGAAHAFTKELVWNIPINPSMPK